jgi:hypothetical protein
MIARAIDDQRRFHFRDIRVSTDTGARAIGAIAAAPASYRVIVKVRHRKLSAIGDSSPRIATNNFAKSETPAPASVAAPYRRLAQVEQLDPLLLPPLSLAR